MDCLATHTSLSPIRRGFAPGFVNYIKGCTRLAVASDKVYQLLANGRWFSSVTPASSNTKTGRHDIAEILMKVVLRHQKSTFKRLYCSHCRVIRCIMIEKSICVVHFCLSSGVVNTYFVKWEIVKISF